MGRYWSDNNSVDTVGQPAEHTVTAIDRERWDGKQDKLVYDTAPTPGSMQPVTSDGIAHAIDESKAFMVAYGVTTVQDIAKAYAEGRCVCAEYEGLIYTLARIDAVYQQALFYCVVPAQNGRVVTHSLTLTGSEWEQSAAESTLPSDFQSATDVTAMAYEDIKALYAEGKDLYIIMEGNRYVCGGYWTELGYLVFYRIHWEGPTARFHISGYYIHKDSDGWIKVAVDSYLKRTEVLNSLTSSETTKALSAAQGKELKRLIDNIINVSPAPIEGNLVKRTLGGNIFTPEPSAGTHAANKDYVDSLFNRVKRPARIGEVVLRADAWEGSDNLYAQQVLIEDVTSYSQVDLTPSAEQLATFYEKDITFVTENENGVITVYVIGQKPQNDYTIQVTITEVHYE